MDQLGLGGAAPMHQTENSFNDDSDIYPRIIGEKRVDREKLGPLKQVEAEADGDCFWQAFALAYAHDAKSFYQIKTRTRYWFQYILRTPGHIRYDLYRRLDAAAGSGTIAQGDLPRLTLTQQFMYSKAWASDEMFQVVADCFDVELVIFSPGKANTLYPVCVRGAHNRRQVLLCMNEDGDHFDALIHDVDGQPRENYRYRYHRISKDGIISDIPFHVFPGEKVDALRGMPLMLGLPHPLPPRRVLPAAEKRRLVAAQLAPSTAAGAATSNGKGANKVPQTGTLANLVVLDGKNGDGKQPRAAAADDEKSNAKGAKKDQQKGAAANLVVLGDGGDNGGQAPPAPKKRKRNGRS